VQGNTIPLFKRPVFKKVLQDRAVPVAQHAVQNELEIGNKRGVRHVIRIELVFGRQNHRVIERLQMIPGYTVQDRFLTSESDCGGASDPGTAGKVGNCMFRQLGTGAHEAHVSGKYVEQLR